VTDKVWGTTHPLVVLTIKEVHRLNIKAGGYCSEHYHNGKHNSFFVVSGTLEITEWSTLTGEEIITVLEAGQAHVVPAMVWHKFRAITDCVCHELYYNDDNSPIDPDDIVRRTEGGVL